MSEVKPRGLNEGTAMIAMSGGVDSSVAAYLTLEAGFDAIGVTMKLYDNELIGEGIGWDNSEDACGYGEGTCCSIYDVEDARSVCNLLGIKYYVFNFEDDFASQVIDRFVQRYEEGKTPNPCIDCNRYMKFEKLIRRANELQIEKIVTGHYARTGLDEETGRYYLRKGLDPSKDQSYVLYNLTQEQLSRVMFPLGELTKDEARRMADSKGFRNAAKQDSQDICFVPDGNYSEFIKRYTGRKYPEGDFVDEEGNVLGRHKGIISYTIGQRKGLGLALKKPMYVVEKDVPGNRVILGDNEDLFSRECLVGDFNWVSRGFSQEEFWAEAKVRYSQTAKSCRVIPISQDEVKIVFDEPERAITPGQAAVIYDGDLVVGGGRIV